MIVVTLLEVSEREEGVVALNLTIGPLKKTSGLEPVSRCEPSTYQSISRYLATAPSGRIVFIRSGEVRSGQSV